MDARVYEARRERVRARLLEDGLGALVVSLAANRFYLSGFELHDPQASESSGLLILTASGRDWLCTDPRYQGAAERLWKNDRIFIYRGDGAEQVNALIKDKIPGSIGFEARGLSMDYFTRFSPGLQLEPADGVVEDLRMRKEPEEIEAIEAATALNHKLMASVPGWLEASRTEAEIAWDIERFFRENGASELAFPSIVAFGPNAALPHHEPSDLALAEDCPVLVDVGCRCRRYCSDQTRTFWFGRAPAPDFSRTLERVRAAQSKAIAALRPGLRVADAYALAWAAFEAEGVAEYFSHGLGHGVGLETHEAPSLNPRSEAVLEPGMVVTVEPGLYYPQWGGVRWEYMVLITPDGCRVL